VNVLRPGSSHRIQGKEFMQHAVELHVLKEDAVSNAPPVTVTIQKNFRC
jgi:hypothetical protein